MRDGVDWPRESADALDGTPYGVEPPRWFAWWEGNDPLRARYEHAVREACSDNVTCPSHVRIVNQLRERVRLP